MQYIRLLNRRPGLKFCVNTSRTCYGRFWRNSIFNSVLRQISI